MKTATRHFVTADTTRTRGMGTPGCAKSRERFPKGFRTSRHRDPQTFSSSGSWPGPRPRSKRLRQTPDSGKRPIQANARFRQTLGTNPSRNPEVGPRWVSHTALARRCGEPIAVKANHEIVCQATVLVGEGGSWASRGKARWATPTFARATTRSERMPCWHRPCGGCSRAWCKPPLPSCKRPETHRPT